MEPRAQIAALLRQQAGWCRRLGSPLYAGLLEAAADDAEAGGPTWVVLRGHEGDHPHSALALRFMGAVHRVVLEGRAPALAEHYPSAGGARAPERTWAAFRAVLEGHRDELRALVERTVQTNEVGRSAALLGGFLVVARDHGLPLRLLEIGASAGFNLRWDHYRYEGAGAAWGDARSPVRLVDVFTTSPPPLEVAAPVAARAGCDLDPIDPTTAEGALVAKSYLWPDQPARFALLEGAIAVARRVPVSVERADASAWLRHALAEPARGQSTVVYHSIVWQYLSRPARAAIADALAAAGARASRAAPLAWLRLEPVGPEGPYEVRLTAWPGGAERRLAVAHPHGRQVRWLAP